MKRRRKRKATLGVQLFPFLAVLLCTMGALILLLVMVVQQAHVSAEVVSARPVSSVPSPPPMDVSQLQESIEENEWRQNLLEKSRADISKQLANQRLELSHLEDHIRRLETRWKQLEAEAKRLAELDQNKGLDAESARRELSELEREIENAKRSLEEAKSRAERQKRTFAVVPYDGPNGTRRRPIYIECTEESIVIQPERVVLRAEDFMGRLSAGNPLDAALRAAREYLARNQDKSSSQGEPYPLLIVRSNGAVAYAAARAAMKSWDDEFGYELVDQDLKLAYPPADPGLTEELNRAVEEARQRQSILASAMPTQFRKSRGAFSSAPGSGFVLEDEDDLGDWSLPGNSSAGNSSAGRSSAGRSLPGKSSNLGGANRNAGPSGLSGGGRASSPPNSQRSSMEQGEGSSPSRGSRSGKEGGENAGSQLAGKSPGATSGAPGGVAFGSSPVAGPLSKRRGTNWGTPGASKGLTGITRPIPVVCLPDRLVLLPDRGESGAPDVTPLPGETIEGIDHFVDAIRKRVAGWGLAVAGGYWKPVLSVQVAPGGESRFADLQLLLENSGFEIKRKTP